MRGTRSGLISIRGDVEGVGWFHDSHFVIILNSEGKTMRKYAIRREIKSRYPV